MKGIFREVYVNFMLIDQTHNDIDALFGRWSIYLRKENFPTIPLVMKLFMDVESIPTIPHYIEQVPYFKGLIVGCIDKETCKKRKESLKNFKSTPI
jgi:hypothetical protein